MLPEDVQIISIDDHVLEHPRVWADRLPASDLDAGPRVVRATTGKYSGHEVWQWEGRQYPIQAQAAFAGRQPGTSNVELIGFEDMRPGCYDPAARVKDMDVDGITAQLCFPSFPRFSGTRFLEATDPDLAVRCVRAYNDFMIDEWHGFEPTRQIPMVILPLWDRAQSIEELRRTIDKGAKAVTFPENPVPLGLPSIYTTHWDPIFARAAEANVPLCMHFGSSGAIPRTAADAPDPTGYALLGSNSMAATMDMLYSGLFVRFPNLKVALSEGGIGWMPYTIERADYTWERHRATHPAIDHGCKPSEMFHGHIFGCFIEDAAGVEARHRIGIDQIMWEGDYPHPDSPWPASRKLLECQLGDLSEMEQRKVLEFNARELYRFPRVEARAA